MRSDPHLIKHTESLEKVQKFALKVCTKSWNSTYSSLLSQMDLPRLDQRRVQLKLFFNSFIKSFIKILSSCTCLVHNVPVIVNVRNNNPLLLSRPICRTNSHYYSFYPHAITLWNDLPHESKREKTFTDFTIWEPCHPWKFLQACHTHLYDQLISILWKISPQNSCQWARSLPTDPRKFSPQKFPTIQ